MIRFLTDENFNRYVLAGIRRRLPDLDIIRVQDVGLRTARDPAVVLEFAASENRSTGSSGDRIPTRSFHKSIGKKASSQPDGAFLLYNFPEMIDAIRSKVADELFEFSKHAVDQSILRNISIGEFVTAIENGIVIEDYPSDKYGPSCLVLGFTKVGRPLHIQCTSGSREILKIITLYEPDESLWIEFRERRNANEG